MPQAVSLGSSSEMRFANPKSAILMSLSSDSEHSRRFSGLRSRCTTEEKEKEKEKEEEKEKRRGERERVEVVWRVSE